MQFSAVRLPQLRLKRVSIMGRKFALAMCFCAFLFAPFEATAQREIEGLFAYHDSATQYEAKSCRILQGTASGADRIEQSALRRISALNQLHWNVHPDRRVREEARRCQDHLDRLSSLQRTAPINQRTLRTELEKLERVFEERLTENEPQLLLTAAHIDDLPPGLVDSASKQIVDAAGQVGYRFGVGLAEYYPLMRYVRDRELRRRLYFAHANRGGKKNVAALERIVALRAGLAKHQQVPTYFDAVAKEQGLPPLAAVQQFLKDLEPSLTRAAALDRSALVGYMPADPNEAGRANLQRIKRWDFLFLLERARLDQIGIGAHAPDSFIAPSLLQRWLFAYFGRLLGLDFSPVSMSVWHEDVNCISVRESRTPPSELGTICFDLFPRPGKYYNYATYVVHERPYAPRTERLAVVLANASRTGLNSDEIERLFSEFAVAIAVLTCDSEECSQGLEAVDPLWQQVQRALFSRIALSEESLEVLRLVDAQSWERSIAHLATLRRGRDFGANLAYARQLTVSQFDLTLMTSSPPVNVMRVWSALEERSGVAHERGTMYPSRLNTIISGSSGLQFTSLWQQVAASDLHAEFNGRTLKDTTALKLKQAFFTPTKHLSFEERFHQLVGRPMDANNFLSALERNAISRPSSESISPAAQVVDGAIK